MSSAWNLSLLILSPDLIFCSYSLCLAAACLVHTADPAAVPATRATKRALVRYTLLSWAMAMARVSSRLRRELDTPQHTKHKG